MCPIKESIVQFTYNRKTVNKCPRLEMSVHRVDFEVRKRTKSKEDNGTLEIAVRRYIETSGYLEVFYIFFINSTQLFLSYIFVEFFSRER